MRMTRMLTCAALTVTIAGCGGDEKSADFGEPQQQGDLTVTVHAPDGFSDDGGAVVNLEVDLVASSDADEDVEVPVPSLRCDGGADAELELGPSNFPQSVSPGRDDRGSYEWIVDGPCDEGTITMAGTKYDFTSLPLP